MSREKQIEEMAKDICRLACSCEECLYPKYRKSTDKCAARMYAERAYNAGYRKQEWISVDERLPERSTSVLAYSKKYNEVDVYYYECANRWWDNDGWASAKYYEITHWMPLPEAPKMKGGAE